MKRQIASEPLEPLIYRLRGVRVLLDADLARLYGVATYRFNEAFKRNRHRFPEDFSFRLNVEEFRTLISQSAISSTQAHESTGHSGRVRHGGRRHLPWAFTEHGALMAANIRRSDRAVHMSVFVVRAFVRLREQVASDAAILKRLAEIDRSLLQHDSALRDLYNKLLPLLQPPAQPPKRRIGFHSE
jgi:hypothetical protein